MFRQISLICLVVLSQLAYSQAMGKVVNEDQLAPSAAFIGEAYKQDSNELLYREYHVFYGDERGTQRAMVQYRFPDGSLKAQKILDFSSGLITPSFDLTDHEFDYSENVSVDKQGALVELRGLNKDGRKKVALKQGKSVIDAGFDQFVQQHWGDLLDGKKKFMEFLSPSRKETISLRVRLNKLENGVAELYLEPKSFFIRLLLDPIKLYYEASSARLLRYEGLTNILREPGDNHVATIKYIYPSSSNALPLFLQQNFEGILALENSGAVTL